MLGKIFDQVQNNVFFMKQAEKEMQQNAENEQVDINTDENAAGTSKLNEPIGEESELEKLNLELQEQKDKYLRLMA